MIEDRITTFLRRYIPVAVVCDLLIALTAFRFAWPATLPYSALAVTMALTIAAGIAYMGSARGMRSTEGLGFSGLRSAFAYQVSGRATSKRFVLLSAAVALVWVHTGTSTPSAVLAFFTFPMLGIYNSVTARYPADKHRS